MTLDSLSCLKAEKSRLFLLCATFFLLRLSAVKNTHTKTDMRAELEQNTEEFITEVR